MGKKKRKSLTELRNFRRGLNSKDRHRLLLAAIEDRDSSLQLLGYDDYMSYLRSKLWSRIRRKIYVRAKNLCEACGEHKPENVHHWSYSVATLQGKKPENLEAVCKICHDQFHEEHLENIARAKGPRQLTPTRLANQAFWLLVRQGGIIAKPTDLTPRLVRKPA